jgi:hypothetical protein
MSAMRFNARLHASHHGPSHPLKDAGVVADSLRGKMKICTKFQTQQLEGRDGTGRMRGWEGV